MSATATLTVCVCVYVYVCVVREGGGEQKVSIVIQFHYNAFNDVVSLCCYCGHSLFTFTGTHVTQALVLIM